MPVTFDPRPAAALLADAWRSGRQLNELPTDVRPADLRQGYDVQDALIAELNEPVAGWKLGMGSPSGKAQTRSPRPIAGRILTSRTFGDGAGLTFPNTAPVTVEFEIAFLLNRDVGAGERIESPLSVVRATHVAFEFVQSRFEDRRAVGWPSFAADNAAFSALVLGQRIDPASVAEIARTLAISAGSEARPSAARGDDAIDPISALGEMLDHARDRGLILPAGTIVSTGTLSQPFDIGEEVPRVGASFAGGALAARIPFRAR